MRRLLTALFVLLLALPCFGAAMTTASRITGTNDGGSSGFSSSNAGLRLAVFLTAGPEYDYAYSDLRDTGSVPIWQDTFEDYAANWTVVDADATLTNDTTNYQSYNDEVFHLASVTVRTGGTGYTVNDVLTVAGGTSTTAATITVTSVAGGVIDGVEVTEPGVYSVLPANINTPTDVGDGSGATVNLVMANRTPIKCLFTAAHDPGAVASHKITRTLAAPVDWSAAGARVILRLYLPTGAGNTLWSKWEVMDLKIEDALGNYGTVVFKGGTPSNLVNGPGWYTFQAPVSAWLYKSATAVDLTAVTALTLDFQTAAAASSVPLLTLDLLQVQTKPSFAAVALSFDDAFNTHDTIAGYLNGRTLGNRNLNPTGHMVGTFYIVGNKIKSTAVSGYLDASELRQMAADGHLIGCHTNTLVAWNNLSLAEKKVTLDAARIKMESMGLGYGAKYIATTDGFYSAADDLTLVTDGYAKSIRWAGVHPSGPLSTTGYVCSPDCLFDPRRIDTTIQAMETATANCYTAQIKSYVDQTITMGGVLVLYNHGLLDGSTLNLNAAGGVLEYIQTKANAGLIRVVTMDQLVNVNRGSAVRKQQSAAGMIGW